MIFRTHLVFALFLGILVYFYFNLDSWWIFFPLVLIFSGVPDIDHPKSKFGRRLKGISVLINFLFKHRGVLHSFIFVLILVGILWSFFGDVVGLGVLAGLLSHILLDSFTLKGVKLFYPFSKFKLKGRIRTGGKLEVVLFYIIFAIDVLMLAKFLN